MKTRDAGLEGGFTLIELMIVVAIVGILLAIGLSSFFQYSVRTRVSEGFALATSAKVAVAENAASGRPLADGFVAPAATTIVTGIAIDAGNGEITITYAPNAGGGTLVLAPRDGPNPLVSGTVPSGIITWNCNAAGSPRPGSAGTLPGRFAPPECR